MKGKRKRKRKGDKKMGKFYKSEKKSGSKIRDNLWD
jgi:hypothetical protein